MDVERRRQKKPDFKGEKRGEGGEEKRVEGGEEKRERERREERKREKEEGREEKVASQLKYREYLSAVDVARALNMFYVHR